MDFDNDDSKVAGTVGALIGAELAIGLWCLIGLLGRVAVIGGVALFLGAYGGYYLLGKGMSKVGLIISTVIVLISVYVATRLNWSISLSRATDMSVSECYKMLPKLIKLAEASGSFYKDLVVGYLITFFGGVVLMAKMR